MRFPTIKRETQERNGMSEKTTEKQTWINETYQMLIVYSEAPPKRCMERAEAAWKLIDANNCTTAPHCTNCNDTGWEDLIGHGGMPCDKCGVYEAHKRSRLSKSNK
jgi:hypothetical protein